VSATIVNGKWEVVIGIECHVQLMTTTKIFSGSSAAFGAQPNSLTDPTVLGLPGALPVMNRRAVEFAVRLGLAAGCTIRPISRFARKHYFYPDLPKGYQISQYDEPLCEGGAIEFVLDGKPHKVALTRIHMEEDAGKSSHLGGAPISLVDLNRAGTPLCEVVSEPDIRSAEEAAEYMRALRQLVRWIGISDGNLEEGSLRCDCNVSLRPVGDPKFGTRTELKNINSFKFVQKAVEYEIARQAQILDGGGRIVQETRLWDAERGTSHSMRSKEDAHDYRYFPDPDLPPLRVPDATIAKIRAELPELPAARRARFMSEYGLAAADAKFLTDERPLADWFEAAARAHGDGK
jgi:aspartyl-tRNA(Asn)/glutamyl-tRNA(Gln) amidotransferase subunit B